MAVDIQNIPPPALSTPLSTGQVTTTDLTDAATNAVSDVTRTTHQSTGTPAAGFGSRWLDRLANAANTLVDAFTVTRRWVTATAPEDSAVDFFAARAGALVRMLTLNAKNASGNYPVELPASNADGASIGLTQNGDQEIDKATGGNFYLRCRNATDAKIGLYGPNYAGITIHQSTGFADAIVCAGSPATTEVDGYFWIPAVQTTGAQTGVPRGVAVGQEYTGHVACVFNKADNKFWMYNGTAWKSITFT